MSAVLEFNGLSKDYCSGFLPKKRFTAVDNINIAVNKGEIFGFLGPNGAGKTTTIKIAMGFLRATSGSVTLFGEDTSNWWVRERVGFLPENPVIYPYLTGYQALYIIGKMFSLKRGHIRKRIQELSQQLGLDLELRLQLRKHSKGMVQRVALAQALINDPDLVILDEPMSGLDPIGRMMFREIILKLKAEGKTVFFSTHILADIEMMCDRIGMLDHGKLVLDATMAQIEERKRERGMTLEQIFMEKVGYSKC